MLYLNEGLYFERLPDGSVRILKKSGNDAESPVIFDHVVDVNGWASVIASMSHYGEERNGFYRALNFHTGEPTPDAHMWELKPYGGFPPVE